MTQAETELCLPLPSREDIERLAKALAYNEWPFANLISRQEWQDSHWKEYEREAKEILIVKSYSKKYCQ